ncbi:hypothetical protein BGY98DRAFT_1178387 [Russula aff. rugulosa BPL654]|nr:hypothetical protein BGY98DRAFT_1178387 [Russula aff. rugulosa BPL654]
MGDKRTVKRVDVAPAFSAGVPSKAWSSSLYRSRMKEAETQRGGGKRSRSTRYRGARPGRAPLVISYWPPSATVELEVTRAEATNDQVQHPSRTHPQYYAAFASSHVILGMVISCSAPQIFFDFPGHVIRNFNFHMRIWISLPRCMAEAVTSIYNLDLAIHKNGAAVGRHPMVHEQSICLRTSHLEPSESVRTAKAHAPSFLTESPHAASISSPMAFPANFPDASPTRSYVVELGAPVLNRG